MKSSSSRTKIFSLLLSTLLVIEIGIKDTFFNKCSCERCSGKYVFDVNLFLFFIFILCLNILCLVVDIILAKKESIKTIARKGSYQIFETIDRDTYYNEFIEKLKSAISNNEHLIELNSNTLTNHDCINLKQKLYQELSKDTKIKVSKKQIYRINNVELIDENFNIESFNERIFFNNITCNKKSINVYIFDSSTTNLFYVYKIRNRLNSLVKNIKKKDKLYTLLNSIYLIYFDRYC